MTEKAQARPLFDGPIMRQAIIASFAKLDPRLQLRNPVMFVVLVGAALTTALWLQALFGQGEAPASFIFAISRLAVAHRPVRATSPRPWPRAVARLRPTPCAGPAAMCRPRS